MLECKAGCKTKNNYVITDVMYYEAALPPGKLRVDPISPWLYPLELKKIFAISYLALRYFFLKLWKKQNVLLFAIKHMQ